VKAREWEIVFLNLLMELFILNISFPFAVPIDFGEGDGGIQEIGYLLLVNLSWIFTRLVFGRHLIYMTGNFSGRFLRITREVIIFFVLSYTLALVLFPDFPRHLLVRFVLVFYLAKVFYSFFLFKYFFYKREKGLNTKRTLIVGVNETARLLRKLFESNPILGYRFVGFVRSGEGAGPDVVGRVEDLEMLIRKNNIQKIFVTTSLVSNPEPVGELLEICNRNGIRLRLVNEDPQQGRGGGVEDLIVINPQELPLDHLRNRIVKRLFDIFFSLVVLIGVFPWLCPVLAVLIKLSSRGPVFFKQKRTGLNNKTFTCLKFRSMRCNPVADIRQATSNDDRITPVGHFMRKFYLDEIPQFLNAFWGDMSVVGPRPHMLKHTEIYEKLIKDYQVRHFYKPGITGWAQVSGYCGETEELWKMQKRIEHDIRYNQNWTFALDLKIIWLTVFGRKGSVKEKSGPRIEEKNIHKEVNRRIYEHMADFLKKAVLIG
jgi:Undecaprenyl-phosphate glucose phosphotransferase